MCFLFLGNPKPGSPDGVGNRPETSPESVLSLTPFGFVPVATFPHFATSRTFAAEAVIFSEIQNIQKFAGDTSNYSLYCLVP